MAKTIVNQTKITFPSLSQNEAYSRSVAASFVSQLNPTYDELSDIKCAVSEAVTNAIVHGYRDKVGEITLVMKITDAREFIAEVRDKGCGIEDIELARRPMFTTDRENERSGMGFTIIENFMDSMKVTSSPGKGTKLLISKKLSALPVRLV